MFIRKVGYIFITVYFLCGQLIFPLGDFSLMRDLSSMYQKYQMVENAKEASPSDFVFDYLLHGETLFGHNLNEAAPKDYGSVQFIHHPNPNNYILISFICPRIQNLTHFGSYTISEVQQFSEGYTHSLFRPPHV
ncbi:MAG: hypothetical protein KKE39_13825 [Bacteroidetes bacterium]|nr:hypothetical protein [Bacteroidota bacterium]MBU1373378.1 hypothetical protein [Bacteroidota bacterium]MBU1485648.1 hypothetical protein [Bacteroidota bacterium]MBU1762008.1 hypothetical protein [Bacteroidota bacterium]MBU2266605.1 hypothetical protein [Bacteroidota bacterium]